MFSALAHSALHPASAQHLLATLQARASVASLQQCPGCHHKADAGRSHRTLGTGAVSSAGVQPLGSLDACQAAAPVLQGGMLASRVFSPVPGTAGDADSGIASAASSSGSFKVVTYNILADKYSGNNSYCSPQHLSWSWRQPLLVSELERYDADLICLQEVEDAFYNQHLQPWMAQRGFSSLYRPRNMGGGFGAAGPLDGVSVHWRNSVFTEVVAAQQLRFADRAAVVLPAAPRGAHTGFGRLVTGKDEGAVMALLRHGDSGTAVLACSTHLHWNPSHPDVKLAQAAILCRAVSEFLYQHIGHLDVPTIIAGDFNSLWRKYQSDPWDELPLGQSMTSGVYTLLSEGRLDSTHPDHPSQRVPQRASAASVGATAEAQRLAKHSFNTAGLKLRSAWMMAHGREPALTTRTTTFSGALDYLFVSQPHFQVTHTLDLPYHDPPQPSPASAVPVAAMPPVPNAEFPSDHLAMGCVVALRQHAASSNAS